MPKGKRREERKGEGELFPRGGISGVLNGGRSYGFARLEQGWRWSMTIMAIPSSTEERCSTVIICHVGADLPVRAVALQSLDVLDSVPKRPVRLSFA